MQNILVGTSSWQEPEFIKDWYPQGLKKEELLTYYAERFNLVEVNSSFYGVPRVESVAKWVAQTPEHFIFDIKLPQLLSFHAMPFRSLTQNVKDVAEVDKRGNAIRSEVAEREMMQSVSDALAPLLEANKLGTTLLQLSPSFSPRDHKLSELDFILDNAPFDVAVEFRNQGWLLDEQIEKTISYLSDHKAIFVNLDAPTGPHFTMMPKVSAATNDKISYLRCHGRNSEAYLKGKTVAERFDYDYSDAEIDEILERAEALLKQSRTVHVLFNNNRSNYAPKAAGKLVQRIGS